MNPRTLAALAVAASTLVVTACGQSNSPETGSNAPTPQTMAPASESKQLIIQGFAAPVPATWTATQPGSTMRVAQFALAGDAGAEAGEVVAYFFPTGQGGPQEANIERWVSQFVSADGQPVTPTITAEKAGDTEVTWVELHGTYARGVGMGPTGEAKPDQSLLSAMVETSIGRITLQMYGPSKTVAGERDNFLKLAHGFRPA